MLNIVLIVAAAVAALVLPTVVAVKQRRSGKTVKQALLGHVCTFFGVLVICAALPLSINAYAEEVMGDIAPQKVQVSVQLDKLKPIMETIAAEKNMSLEDFFILYMDIQSEASCLSDQKMRDSIQDINEGEGMPLLYR